MALNVNRHKSRFLLVACLLVVSSQALSQDAVAGKAKSAQVCAACHGADGNSISPDFPNLAGQTARYIYVQLKDYKEGRRKHEVMTAMAQPLSRADMFDIDAFYETQKPKPTDFKVDEKRADLGRAKAEETLCTMCHLGGFAGQNEIPRVSGQHYQYTVKQLADFKAYGRTNDGGNMASVSKTLSDEDIINIGHYLTGLR